MEQMTHLWMQSLSLPGLFVLIAVCIGALGKGADLLVDEAVRLALRWKVPTIIVGATIVSLGTTLPEAAVSVVAAVKGSPSIALGNAVGSIICDTGLVLGLATILSPPPLSSKLVHRQGWLQLAAGFLLVFSCLPSLSFRQAFSIGGKLPQHMGIIFLLLLAVYIWVSLKWIRQDRSPGNDHSSEAPDIELSGWKNAAFLLLGIALIIIGSHLLIPAVQISALRIGVPESIVGATLVAFGTSLPELVTALTAVRKGHGDLAVGNVIGADILNVLFVAGAAASVTSGGLAAPAHFFQALFPAMLLLLLVFRAGIYFSNGILARPFGFLLLSVYMASTLISYTYRHGL
jgi:cation:H+ antiporter